MAARTFQDMLASTSDAALGALMRDRLTRALAAHDAGFGEHPAKAWNLQNDALKAHRAAKDAAGSGLGSRELEEGDQPKAQDNPPETPGTPRAPYGGPGASGAELQRGLTQNRPDDDSRMRQGQDADIAGGTFAMGLDGVPRFTTTRGVILEGNAALEAHAKRSNPENVTAMAALIPGYGRLNK